MWLGRSTKVLNSQCLGSLTVLLAQQARMTPHHTRQKNHGSHTIACVRNVVHVNYRTCTYVFPKQTESILSHWKSFLKEIFKNGHLTKETEEDNSSFVLGDLFLKIWKFMKMWKWKSWKSCSMKILQYICIITLQFLRYTHFRYVKCLFTNI